MRKVLRILRNQHKFTDPIVAFKGEYSPRRVAIANKDTSGLEITLEKQVPNDTSSMTDIEGNPYRTVKIGDQIWMAENLRTTKYNNSTPIQYEENIADWKMSKGAKYCFYNNTTNSDTIKKFGAIYNWYVVKTGKLAPAGLHVPTLTDWNTLQNYLIQSGYNWDGTTIDNKVSKSLAAQSDWVSYTTIGTIGRDLQHNNRSGFTAIPAGERSNLGGFGTAGRCTHWWSSTEYVSPLAFFCYLYNDENKLVIGHSWGDSDESTGYSVRLVKD